MDLKYWKQFEHSGKIEDYLTFKACGSKRDSEWKNAGNDGGAGEDTDAGIYQRNRDRIKADPCGGIRQTY